MGIPQRSIRVAIDCGNAVPGPLTVSLMQKLGVDLVPIHCDWDNTFPNHPPDPTRQKNMVDLSKAVVENYANLESVWMEMNESASLMSKVDSYTQTV